MRGEKGGKQKSAERGGGCFILGVAKTHRFGISESSVEVNDPDL